MAEKTSEPKVLLEREYVIPLRSAWLKAVDYKRARKAVKTVRTFIAKHMKVPQRDESQVKINRWLNHELWFRGIKHPPAKIKVKARKYIDHVDVELAEIPDKVKWMIARETKMFTNPGKPKKDSKKKDSPEKNEVTATQVEDKKEKVEATKEAGMQHAHDEHQHHKHETEHHKAKTTPRRMALKK